MDRSEPILAIDFGTSSSVAYLVPPGGEPEEVREPPSQRTFLWPSAVLAAGGTLLVGSEAEARKLDDAQHARAYRNEFKRDLGSPDPVWPGQSHQPRDLVRALIGKMARAAREQLARATGDAPGITLGRTVLTIPPSYEPAGTLRELMLSAAEDEGLGPVELLPEPVAAAWGIRAQLTRTRSQLVLVYDFGGGTFDTALIEVGPGSEWQVLGMASQNTGGKDIDADLVGLMRSRNADWLARRLRETAPHEAEDARRRFEVASSAEAERLKRQLTDVKSAPGQILDAPSVSVTVEELEELARRHVGATIQCCRGLLADTGKTVADLDAILLVGGATKMPLVRRMLREELAKDLPHGRQVPLGEGLPLDPDLAVALGAARWAIVNEICSLRPAEYRPGRSVLRWDLDHPERPGYTEPRLMRWLVEPGQPYQAGTTPLARIRYANGTLWDLTASEPGRFGGPLADPPDTPGAAETGEPITSRQWIATTDRS